MIFQYLTTAQHHSIMKSRKVISSISTTLTPRVWFLVDTSQVLQLLCWRKAWEIHHIVLRQTIVIIALSANQKCRECVCVCALALSKSNWYKSIRNIFKHLFCKARGFFLCFSAVPCWIVSQCRGPQLTEYFCTLLVIVNYDLQERSNFFFSSLFNYGSYRIFESFQW